MIKGKRRFGSLALIVVFMLLIVGCGNQESVMETRNKEVVGRFVEAGNNGELDLLDNLVKSSFIRHCQATPDVKVRSLEEFKLFYQETAKTFPDQHVMIDKIVAEGNLVAFYGAFAGTQSGQMGPFPPTGKRMEVDMGGVFRLEDGEIAELWVTWDNVAGLMQLGFFPPPGEGGGNGQTP